MEGTHLYTMHTQSMYALITCASVTQLDGRDTYKHALRCKSVPRKFRSTCSGTRSSPHPAGVSTMVGRCTRCGTHSRTVLARPRHSFWVHTESMFRTNPLVLCSSSHNKARGAVLPQLKHVSNEGLREVVRHCLE